MTGPNEISWSLLPPVFGEHYVAVYRGVTLEVTRRHAQKSVVGRISSADGDVERFTASCTIDEAKARCVRVADRLASATDVPREEMRCNIEAARRGDA